MTIQGVLETSLYATDLDGAEHFYAKVLGLAIVGRAPGRHIFFRCGNAMLLVFDPTRTATVASAVGGVPVPLHGATGPGHVCFRVADTELPAWRERLLQAQAPIEAEVEWPGGGTSIYVRDPAGNSIEFASGRIWGLGDAVR